MGGQKGRPKGRQKWEAKVRSQRGSQNGRPKGEAKGEAKVGGQSGGQSGRPKVEAKVGGQRRAKLNHPLIY